MAQHSPLWERDLRGSAAKLLNLESGWREAFVDLRTTFSSPVVYLTRGFRTASKLDFIQLRGIAHRIHEAFEQFTRNLYHVGLLE